MENRHKSGDSVIDFSGMNKVMLADHHQMPTPEESFSQLNGCEDIDFYNTRPPLGLPSRSHH
jgi:hypothetical protein